VSLATLAALSHESLWPKFARKTGKSRYGSKANFQNGNFAVRIQPLQPSLPILFSRRVRKPTNRGLVCALQSPRFQDSNQNSQFGRKVSRVFLGNGRFAESKSGDWFDHQLSDRGTGIRTGACGFACIGPSNQGIALARRRSNLRISFPTTALREPIRAMTGSATNPPMDRNLAEVPTELTIISGKIAKTRWIEGGG
jgi:hypothetical protein